MKFKFKNSLVLCLLFAANVAIANDSKKINGAQTKKIRLQNSNQQQSRQLLDAVSDALLKQIKICAKLKDKNIIVNSVKPLLWQSYIWMEYDLCEEAVLIAQFEPQKENVYLLVKLTRQPYETIESGKTSWKIEWLPGCVIDGSQYFDWEIFKIDELKKPGFILRWCNNRHFFENGNSDGTSLLQRWAFPENWKFSLGRDLTRKELQVFQGSSISLEIKVPLDD